MAAGIDNDDTCVTAAQESGNSLWAPLSHRWLGQKKRSKGKRRRELETRLVYVRTHYLAENR